MLSEFSRDEKIRLAGLLASAALVRGVYLALYSADPVWSDLIVDSLFHVNWADTIAGGNILGEETYFRAPFYIYILSVLRAIGPDSILLPRLFGSLLGVVSVLLTYTITRRVVSGRQAEGAALAAGVLQALYPSVIYFEAELLVDFLFAFLLQLTVYLTIRAKAKHGTSLMPWVFVGLALGLASITRPTGLALYPLFAYFAWCRPAIIGSVSRATSSIRALWRPLALGLALGLVVAPVAIRNVVVADDLTLIASSGGINFFIGNNAESNPVSASLPAPLGASWTAADMIGLAEIEEGRALKPSEVSWSWTKRALDWIAAHPFDFAQGYLRKLYVIFANHPYSNNRSLGSAFENNLVLRYIPLNFAILLALTVIGGLGTLGARMRREKGFGLPVLIAVCYAGLVCLFFVTERFRMPALVLLFPAAGVGVAMFFNSVKDFLKSKPDGSDHSVRETAKPCQGRQRGRAAALAALAGLAFVLTLLPWGRPVENAQARTKYLEANGYLSAGELSEAVTSFRELLALDPSYPRAAQNLGVAYFLQANGDSAERYFRRELELAPGAPEALMNLASLKLTSGDILGADSLSLQALIARPYDLTTFRVRVRALQSAARFNEAAKIISQAELSFGHELGYWYDRGANYLRLGDSSAALEAFVNGADLDGGDPFAIETAITGAIRGDRADIQRTQLRSRVNYQAGFLCGAQGRLDESAKYSAQAIAGDSSLLAAYVNLSLAYLGQGKQDSARIIRLLATEKFGGDPRYDQGLRRLGAAFGN